MAGEISFDSMSGEIDLKTSNRKFVRTRFHVDDNKLYYTSDYGNNTESKELPNGFETKMLSNLKKILNSNENFYFFGGKKVHQGELLNKNLLALMPHISSQQPGVTAYKIIGKSKYRERVIIAAIPIINSPSLKYHPAMEQVEALEEFASDPTLSIGRQIEAQRKADSIRAKYENYYLSLNPDNVVYIDQRTGIISFYKMKAALLNEGREVFSITMGYDTTFLNSKTLPMKYDDIIDLNKFENKCRELGFTKGTEKYGNCVMKLLD